MIISNINDNLEQLAQTIFDNEFGDTKSPESSIGNVLLPKRGKGLLSKDALLGDIPVVAGGLEPATYHNVANTTAPVITISASGANAGFIRLWNTPVWSSDSSFIDESITGNVYFWYVLLKKRQKEIFESQTGSAQPHIYPKHIGEMPVINIEEHRICVYNDLVTPLFRQIGQNTKQIVHLTNIRDTLLPKLMSGEIDVSQVEV